MRNALAAVLLVVAGFTVSLGAEEILWNTDVHEAFQSARAQNKPVLIYFTGSDWCPWCRRLDKEILGTPVFASASAGWVLLKADFLRYGFQEESLRNQNERLMQIYGVQGFPMLILTDGKGNELGRVGYQRTSPEAFVAKLNAFIQR